MVTMRDLIKEGYDLDANIEIWEQDNTHRKIAQRTGYRREASGPTSILFEVLPLKENPCE